MLLISPRWSSNRVPPSFVGDGIHMMDATKNAQHVTTSDGRQRNEQRKPRRQAFTATRSRSYSPHRRHHIQPRIATVFVRPETFAVDVFFSDYVLSKGKLLLFCSLPGIYYCPESPICLKEMVLAVALASLSNQQHRSNFMMLARHYYNRSLRSLNTALGNVEMAKSDGVITTVALFGIFEVCKKKKKQKAI